MTTYFLKLNHAKRIFAFNILGSLLLILTLMQGPRLASATACDTSDYLSLVGSSHHKMKTVYAAPNSLDDLIVAGIHNDRATGTGVDKLLIYLLNQSECRYTWTYQGGDNLSTYPRGVTWSVDETRAYVLTVDAVNSPKYEYLIVFKQARSSYYGGAPIIYEIALDENAFNEVVRNMVSIYGLPGQGGTERLLIVRQNNFGFMRMFSDDSGVLTNRVADANYRTLDSTINTDGDSLYIAYKSADALEVVK